MQHEELEKLTQMYIRKLPFVKALILSELVEGVEVYKYVAEDIKLSVVPTNEFYLNGLR